MKRKKKYIRNALSILLINVGEECVLSYLEELIYHREEHNHVPERVDFEVRKILGNIREKAAECLTSSTQQVLLEAVSVASQSVAASLPSASALGKTIQRIRRRKGGVPCLPSTFQELIVSFPYTVTLRNEQFLLFDSVVEDKERILLFPTRHNLELLSES